MRPPLPPNEVQFPLLDAVLFGTAPLLVEPVLLLLGAVLTPEEFLDVVEPTLVLLEPDEVAGLETELLVLAPV